MNNGIGDIIGGAALIAIGLSFGGSIFTGNPSLFDWAFDLLGIFWVGRGVVKLIGSRPQTNPAP